MFQGRSLRHSSVPGRLEEGLELASTREGNVAQYVHEIKHGFTSSIGRIGLDMSLQLLKTFDLQVAVLARSHNSQSAHVRSDNHFHAVWNFLSFYEPRSALVSLRAANLLEIIQHEFDYLWKRFLDDRGLKWISAGNFEKAFEEYRGHKLAFEAVNIPIPELLHQRLANLEWVLIAEGEGDAQALLEVAIFLRDVGAREGALERFEAVSNNAGNPIVAQKALYLGAAMLRRMDDYAAAKSVFSQLWKKYPEGQLADDALAEIGWYHLIVRREREKAHEYFNKVVELYPERNAADNALNWIAWSNLVAGDYASAFNNYMKLTVDYGASRLGRRAVKTAQKLKELLKSVRTVKRVAGIRVFENMVYGVDSRDSDFERGDRIIKLNGYSVTDRYSLKRALDSVSTKYTDVVVLRGSLDLRLTLRALVEEAEVYDRYWPDPRDG